MVDLKGMEPRKEEISGKFMDLNGTQ